MPACSWVFSSGEESSSINNGRAPATTNGSLSSAFALRLRTVPAACSSALRSWTANTPRIRGIASFSVAIRLASCGMTLIFRKAPAACSCTRALGTDAMSNNGARTPMWTSRDLLSACIARFLIHPQTCSWVRRRVSCAAVTAASSSAPMASSSDGGTAWRMCSRGGTAPESTMRSLLSPLTLRFLKMTAACSRSWASGDRSRRTSASRAPSSTILVLLSAVTLRLRRPTAACSWVRGSWQDSSATNAGSAPS
mmetsp:Transcript_6337/g.14589  ORF Transcript_6337/g.14589 Transcript_6337/m.14589 type:complete len:253 (+) Transcript_6337:74-832(+)